METWSGLAWSGSIWSAEHWPRIGGGKEAWHVPRYKEKRVPSNAASARSVPSVATHDLETEPAGPLRTNSFPVFYRGTFCATRVPTSIQLLCMYLHGLTLPALSGIPKMPRDATHPRDIQVPTAVGYIDCDMSLRLRRKTRREEYQNNIKTSVKISVFRVNNTSTIKNL